MSLLTRLAERAGRRPFGAFESWFYESAGSAAVADALHARFEAHLGEAARVLDVGCGGGVLATRLASGGRTVIGADPSAPQVLRAHAAGVAIARAGAERLPFPDGAYDAVVSCCSIKHWADRPAGVAECLRTVRPGGVVVLAEIDGASTRARLRGFAATTRIPRPLHPLYPTFARAAMVVVSPTAEDLADALAGAGAIEVTSEQVDDLPFALAAGRRQS